MADYGARDDRPFYLCLGDLGFGRELVEDLRGHGLRARVFASDALLANAAAAEAPAAVIATPRALPDPVGAVGTGTGIDLIALVEGDTLTERLAVARAGYHTCFQHPLNRPALIQRLQSGSRRRADRWRVCVVASESSDLAAATATLPEGFEVRRVHAGDGLLAQLVSRRPAVIMIDGDSGSPSAIDLATAVRQHQSLTTIPLIIATAGDKRAFDAVGSACGLDALIGLPIDARDLAGILTARARRAQDQAAAYAYLARRDGLTGLYNRGHFVDVLSQCLAAHGSDANLAVIQARLEPGPACDGVAQHEAALVQTADRLRRQLPPLAVAARLDHDTFGVLLTGLGEARLQQTFADLQGDLQRVEWQSHGQTLSAGLALGLAIADGTEQSASELVRKAQRPARPVPADGHDNGDGLDDYWRETVAGALAENRFRLVYQPISSLNGHPGSLFEVFLRLTGPDGGEVLPGEFLPGAQRAGLGGELDRWVLDRAIHVLGERDARTTPTLFVKLLAESARDEGLAAFLAQRLRQEGVEPGRLVVQIPHAALLSHADATRRLMQALADVGCGVALEYFDDSEDDGTTLERAGFQYLKLHPRLTAGIVGDRDAAERVRGLTGIARRQGIHSIASIVQDATALSSLWQAGVDYIQGNFMQAPTDVFADT